MFRQDRDFYCEKKNQGEYLRICADNKMFIDQHKDGNIY